MLCNSCFVYSVQAAPIHLCYDVCMKLLTAFRMHQFAAAPPYTVSILHIRMLQLTIQKPSATGRWPAYKSLAISICYLPLASHFYPLLAVSWYPDYIRPTPGIFIQGTHNCSNFVPLMCTAIVCPMWTFVLAVLTLKPALSPTATTPSASSCNSATEVANAIS